MTTMNRRSLLNAGLGVSAAALGAPLLSACGGSNDGGGAGKAGEAAATPVYDAAKGPKPDIVGDGQIPDTYFIDEQGNVRDVFINVRKWGSPTAVQCVESMLAR